MTLPVGEPCGELVQMGGPDGGGRLTTGGGGTEVCGGGGDVRTIFGLWAAEILARRVWNDAADGYDNGIPGGKSGGGALW